MNIEKGFVPFLLMAAVLGACAVEPPPPDRFFRIEVAPPAAATPLSYRVQVEPVEAAGMYTQRPLVLQREDAGGALEQYHYYFWSEPPDLLLTDALVQYLRSALGAGQVYGPGDGVRADVIVRARLRKLDQQVSSAGARSVLALQFTVRDRRRGGGVSVVDFEESAPAGNGAPAAHVETLNRLAARAFARLGERLSAGVGNPAVAGP